MNCFQSYFFIRTKWAWGPRVTGRERFERRTDTLLVLVISWNLFTVTTTENIAILISSSFIRENVVPS